MRKVERLKIGGVTVTVERKAEKFFPDNHGEFNSTTNTISICETLPPDKAVEILFHELMHFVLSRSMFRPMLDTTEEQVCDAAAIVIAALFVQNQAFLRRLLDELKRGKA